MKNVLRFSRLLIILMTCWLLSSVNVVHVIAQDGPQCPPGFTFDRLSGVGCIQENCFDIGQAHLSYTGQCICAESYKMCTKPVDYESFNQEDCAPFCPVSELVSCVSLESECPQLGLDASGDESLDLVPNMDSLQNGNQESTIKNNGSQLTDLEKDLENFLVGESKGEIDPKGVAATGVATIALLSAWIFTQLAAGNSLSDLLSAIKSFFNQNQSNPSGLTSKAESNFPPTMQNPVKSTGKKTDQQLGNPPLHLQSQKPQTATAELPKPDQTVIAQPISNQSKPKIIEMPPPADPQKINQLKQKFKEMVDLALEKNMYVMNRSVLEKVWNKFVMVDGWVNILLQDKYGGQCGEYAQWGEQWTNTFIKDIFGEGVMVDTIYVGEKSSISKETMLTDPFERIDRMIESNHAATRVILPTGESFILDYWQAIGDHQRGVFEKAVDFSYDQIFGGSPKYPEVKIYTEKEWINKWKPKIESMFDGAVVHNINPSQSILLDLIKKCSTEEEAFARYRKGVGLGKLSDAQTETIINSYKKGGVWWEKLNER